MSRLDISVFGKLLRRFRLAAALSQDALAKRARLSARGISDLERGINHTPRRDTLELLVEALELSPTDRALLEAAAGRRTERERARQIRRGAG